MGGGGGGCVGLWHALVLIARKSCCTRCQSTVAERNWAPSGDVTQHPRFFFGAAKTAPQNEGYAGWYLCVYVMVWVMRNVDLACSKPLVKIIFTR